MDVYYETCEISVYIGYAIALTGVMGELIREIPKKENQDDINRAVTQLLSLIGMMAVHLRTCETKTDSVVDFVRKLDIGKED